MATFSKRQTTLTSNNRSGSAGNKIPQSVVFLNYSFDESNTNLLDNLQRRCSEIQRVYQVYISDDGTEEPACAIKIDMQSDYFLKKCLLQKEIHFFRDSFAIRELPLSLIVFKVPPNATNAQILQDLGHNYFGIKNTARFFYNNDNPTDIIRLDFINEPSYKKIIKDNYVFIDGNRCPIQPLWFLVNQHIETRVLPAPETPVSQATNGKLVHSPENKEKEPLTNQRVQDLITTQEKELQTIVNEFEDKWYQRLSALRTSLDNTDVERLSKLLQDFQLTCQRLNQKNIQMQRQMATVINELQQKRPKSSLDQQWPTVSFQNGHPK